MVRTNNLMVLSSEALFQYSIIPSRHYSNPVGILIAVKCRMKDFLIRSISVFFLSLLSVFYLNSVEASPHPATEKSYKGTISRIVSITTHKSKGQTIVTVLGDGKVSAYKAKPLKAPPRIVVDIFCAARLLGGMSKVVENSDVKIIRIGYHAQKIRIVFDIKGSVVPSFTDKSVDNELIITLKSKGSEDKNKHGNTTNVIEKKRI